MEWELLASSSPIAGGKGGLISHTRNLILGMSGRSLLLVLPTQRELFLKRCKIKLAWFAYLEILIRGYYIEWWKYICFMQRYWGQAAQLCYSKVCQGSTHKKWEEDCCFCPKWWLLELHWRECECLPSLLAVITYWLILFDYLLLTRIVARGCRTKFWLLDLDGRVTLWEIFLVSGLRLWRFLVSLFWLSSRRRRRNRGLKCVGQ